MVALHAGVEVKIDVLESEGGEEDDGGEDFARAAGGEPALDPNEQHAGEEHVSEGEGCEEGCGPWGERRLCDGDAYAGGDECQSADDVRCTEQAEDEARGEVAREAEGEA